MNVCSCPDGKKSKGGLGSVGKRIGDCGGEVRSTKEISTKSIIEREIDFK